MDPAIYAFIAVGTSILGLFIGSWAKRKSLLIIPFTDPLSWMLLMFVFAILIIPDLWPQYAFINPYNLNHDACLIGFFVTYVYGYCKEELLYEYVSSHNIFKLQQIVKPIAYYVNPEGQLCWQPQKARYVIKRMIFGIENPANFPVNEINRRRYIEFQGKFLTLSAYCIDVTAIKETEITVRRFHINFKAIRLEFDPSPLNTYDPYDFYTEGRIADEYIQNYQRLKIENANASADVRMAKILGAVKIVESITSMTPDAIVLGRIEGDLEARNGDTQRGVEKASKVGVDDLQTKERRSRLLNRKGGDAE